MKTTIRYISGVVFASILIAIFATIYVLMHSQQTKTLPQKIVYFPNGQDRLPIFFIKNLKFRNPYVDYVNKQLSNNIHETIKFPYQNGLAYGDTIYIRKYLEDSILVEFYCPKYHNQIWGLRTGYVHRALIHDALKID